MFLTLPSPNNCFYPVAHNSSYGDTTITYKIKGGGSKSSVEGKYSVAFKEKTNGEMGIMCSDEQTCWVACECQSGWSTSAPSGEYVYAKDDRYANGLSSMSANGSLSSMSANGNLSTMSDNYSISTMATNGGMTCYKKACSSGYYLDTPSTSYFKRTSSTGTLGLTCWKTTGCASGYSENATGTAHSYNDRTCKQCVYTCPDGSQESTCGSSYYQTGKTSMYCIGDSSQTKGTCYKCAACSWVCPSGKYYDGSEGNSYYITGDDSKEVCDGDTSKTRPGGGNVCYSRKSCSWVCPDNTYTTAPNGYYLSGDGSKEVCNGDKSKTRPGGSKVCQPIEKCTWSCSTGYSTSTTSSSCTSSQYFTSKSATKADSSCANKTCGKCNDCKWICQNGYYDSASGDYKLTSTSTAKVCNGDTSKKHSSQKCYTRTLKGCTDYNSSYKSSVPSGQTCDPVNPRSGLTCYTNCKKDIYWPDQYYIQIKICETGAPSTTCWLDSQDVIAKLQYSTGDSETQNGSKASDFVIISPTEQNLYLMWDNSATEIPTHIGSLTPNNGELNFETNCMMRPHGACNGPSSTGFTCPRGWGGNLTNNPTAQLVTQYHNYSETMDDVTLKHIPTDQTKKVTLKLKADPVWGGGLLSGGCK